MYKKILVMLVSISMVFANIPIEAYASTNSVSVNDYHSNNATNIDAATAANNMKTVNDIVTQWKFSQNQGHGFAAEQGNNLIDRIKGHNASVIGDNNVKNGADRKIIGRDGSTTFIQDKYYKTASESISACFDESGFRYFDGNGNPMQIEVPKDQYADAVSKMRTMIEQGKVKGVTDPKEAETIVRKGNLTYQQAKNLAKAGTVESLKYDAANGVISAGIAFGISTLLNYACYRMRGENREDALKESAKQGVQSGVGVFCTAVIAGQLSKTGIMNVFKPSTEALTEALGDDFSKALIKASGQKVIAAEGESVAQSATKQAAGILRSHVLVATVTTVVFTIDDAVDLFRGRISKEQFIKNFAKTAASVAVGTVGGIGGAAVGNMIAPGAGTIPGGIAGSLVGGTAGVLVADKIADKVVEDDAEKMYEIIEKEYARYCDDYIVNDKEAKNIISKFNKDLDEEMLKQMYQSKDRKKFIDNKLEPLFEAEVKKRKKVEAPTEDEMRQAMKEELNGVVFIH